MRGTALSTSLGSSCPSASETGPMHDDQRGLVSHVLTDYAFATILFNSADLYSLSSDLFEFARRSEEGELRLRLGRERTRAALFNCRTREDDHPDLFKL